MKVKTEHKILLKTAVNVVKRPRKQLGRLINRNELPMAFDLGTGASFTQANPRRMDKRIKENPMEAIGGDTLGIGRLQLKYLKQEGLKPGHRLLDFGCGTLRAGKHFIRYLEPGNYTGLDISPEAIKYGERWVEENGLADKKPVLQVNNRVELERVKDSSFDFVVAQSVFTHLPWQDLDLFLENLDGVLSESGKAYLTFWIIHDKDFRVNSVSSFAYGLGFIEDLADRHGFCVDLDSSFNHPRGQEMVVFSR